MSSLLSIVFSLLLGVGALAQPLDRIPVRAVTLDWDPIEEAMFYDVEIQAKSEQGLAVGKPKTHLTTEAKFQGKLEPGYYSMRVRGKDRRKVPGDWSDVMDLVVMLENTKVTSPGKLHILQASDPDFEKSIFKWQAVPGAIKYQVALESEDKSFAETLKTEDLSLEAKIPVGKKVTWKLKALGDHNLESESETIGVVEVWGPTLTLAKIAKPETKFVREVSWTGTKYDKSYATRTDRWDPLSKKWIEVASKKSLTEPKVDFPPDAPGGQYRVVVKSEAPLRRPSKLAVIQFPVVNGDRSPASEYRATLRESIERTKGWFLIASYFITDVDYKGRNADNVSNGQILSAFKSNGGTGRLGAGFLPEKAPWGFMGAMDLSGFFIGDKTPTYPALEVNAIRRVESGQIGEIRHQMGVSYKEVPEIVPINANQFKVESIAAFGLHYGLEYWWALSPKLGFQINGHLYPYLGSVRTPNGNNVTPSLSYQFGLLGSYRLWPNATGLMGYAYRSDNLSYRANSGDKNAVDISGHYLNFFLEWSL